jgi:hypothetical protein
VEYIGRNGTKVLFSEGGSSVVVDESDNSVTRLPRAEAVTAGAWGREGEGPSERAAELASATLTDFDITVLGDNQRLYTIPKGVQAEAKRALEWRKQHGRGGTPVGVNTARTLAKGGQIGIQKVRHIAKYFPRHEVDKGGKGYKPGDEGYPSKGRIAWALWGGDAAQRWASGVVKRDDLRKSSASVVASLGYVEHEVPPRVDYNSFLPVSESSPEFFVRIRLDSGEVDRLYRVSDGGACSVWDDGYWDDLGNVEHDFSTYDRSLDDPYDSVLKIHVPVDRDSALAIAAVLDADPLGTVDPLSLFPEEAEVLVRAVPDVDWAFVDQLSEDELEDVDYFDDGLTAAITAALPNTNQDGDYTPEERSQKAQAQVRDKLGKFAKSGSTVVIGGNPDYSGRIVSINGETQEVNVQLKDGSTVSVPANLTQEIGTFEPVRKSNFPQSNLDFTGILGEPRVPIDQPLAMLPGRLPPLTAPDVNLLVSDWGAWVSGQRLSPEYEGTPPPRFVPKALPDINTVMGQYYRGAFNPDGSAKPGWNPAVAPNAYNDPLLRNWLDRRYANKSGEVGYHNRGWYTPKPASVPVDPTKSRSEVYSPSNRNRLDDRYNPRNFAAISAAAEAEESEELTPETSDVPAMYMAIVAPDDPQAVMDLISVVPAGKKTSEPAAFVRKPGKWQRDDSIIRDLNSPTPPPVVVLDNEMLSEVTKQIDGEVVTGSSGVPYAVVYSNNAMIAALVAKGGPDRNRGGAEKLRRYWTVGPGALKIRWNTPGDWTRCYRQLAKYMGPRAKGYCSLRHKEMTGTWPGSKYNVGKKKKRGGGRGRVASAGGPIETVKTEQRLVNEFTLRARAESARSRLKGGRAGASPVEHGAKFVIPLVIPEGVETGDGRIFEPESIEIRDLPLPLMWQIKSGQGHDGSVVIGQILSMERTQDGIGNAYGVFDTGAYGQEAERLVRNGFIRGVSADMDKFEADTESAEDDASGDSSDIGQDRIKITSARVMAVTVVPKPAFQECFIQIVDEPEEGEMVPDGVYVEGMDPLEASALVACGIVAGAVPLEPPTEWFVDPRLSGPTPLTVTDEGRVFGHIAAWHVDHIGMSFGTKPPRSRSKYAYFHTGVVRTAEGSDVPVGQLTLAGGHASLEASAQQAVRHYDDTASAIADVHAGEDAHGIWVAGSLRPGATPEQVRALRASSPSGDWRPIKGQLELVAVCQVNVPGFPIARARVASGQVMALVAAGASTLAHLKDDPIADLSRKVDMLLADRGEPTLASAAEQVRARFSGMAQEVHRLRASELSARVRKTKGGLEDEDYMVQIFDENPEQEMSVISRRVRERLAKEGKALPDGSYPIRNVTDLRNAVRSYGRAKTGAKAAVRKHIMRRARGLNRQDLIPSDWSGAPKKYADGE